MTRVQTLGISFWGDVTFERWKESTEDGEGRVRQEINVIFKELIYKLLIKIWDNSYYKKSLPIEEDPKKHTQQWKYAYHEKKRA